MTFPSILIIIYSMKKAFIPIFLGALLGISPARAYEEADLIALARANVEAAVQNQTPPAPEKGERARPVFVTIERGGKVIGCRGTLQARFGSLQAEVAGAARSATRSDPRYRPLTPADLKNYLVTVTVIESQTPLGIANIGSLQRGEGLVLQSGNRVGVVLPWEGNDARVRLGWAYKKAGVAPGASCRLYRLQAARFRG